MRRAGMHISPIRAAAEQAGIGQLLVTRGGVRDAQVGLVDDTGTPSLAPGRPLARKATSKSTNLLFAELNLQKRQNAVSPFLEQELAKPIGVSCSFSEKGEIAFCLFCC
jgi:hypothetical protein